MFGEIFYFIGVTSIVGVITRYLRKEKNPTIENEDAWEYMCIGGFISFFCVFFYLTNIAIQRGVCINSNIKNIKDATFGINILVLGIYALLVFNIEKIKLKKLKTDRFYSLLVSIVILTFIQGILGGEVYHCYIQIIGQPENNVISEMFFIFSTYVISLISSYLLVVQILIAYDTEEYKDKEYFILLEPTAYALIRNSKQVIEGNNPLLGKICKENNEYILLQTNNDEKLYISKQYVISKKCAEIIPPTT